MVMSVWLGCAAATLLLSMISGNFFGTMGSTCALVGACTHRFPACRGGADLAACITRCHTLAVVAASLCGIIAALSTLIAFGLSAA